VYDILLVSCLHEKVYSDPKVLNGLKKVCIGSAVHCCAVQIVSVHRRHGHPWNFDDLCVLMIDQLLISQVQKN
jgi:hypothetical protein